MLLYDICGLREGGVEGLTLDSRVLLGISGTTHCVNNRIGSMMGSLSGVSVEFTVYFPSICRVNVSGLNVVVLCGVFGRHRSI